MRQHPYRIATDWQVERFRTAVRELHERAVDPQLAAVLQLARAELPDVTDEEVEDVFAFIPDEVAPGDVAQYAKAAQRNGQFEQRTQLPPLWSTPAADEILRVHCAAPPVGKARRQPDLAIPSTTDKRGLVASAFSPAMRDLILLVSTRASVVRRVNSEREAEQALRDLRSRIPCPTVTAAASLTPTKTKPLKKYTGGRGWFTVTLTASGNRVVTDRRGRRLPEGFLLALEGARERSRQQQRTAVEEALAALQRRTGAPIRSYDWRF